VTKSEYIQGSEAAKLLQVVNAEIAAGPHENSSQ
jgi:hypothetical protein